MAILVIGDCCDQSTVNTGNGEKSFDLHVTINNWWVTGEPPHTVRVSTPLLFPGTWVIDVEVVSPLGYRAWIGGNFFVSLPDNAHFGNLNVPVGALNWFDLLVTGTPGTIPGDKGGYLWISAPQEVVADLTGGVISTPCSPTMPSPTGDQPIFNFEVSNDPPQGFTPFDQPLPLWQSGGTPQNTMLRISGHLLDPAP